MALRAMALWKGPRGAPNSAFSQNKPNAIRHNISGSVSSVVFVCSSCSHLLSIIGVCEQLFPYCEPHCPPQVSLCGRRGNSPSSEMEN